MEKLGTASWTRTSISGVGIPNIIPYTIAVLLFRLIYETLQLCFGCIPFMIINDYGKSAALHFFLRWLHIVLYDSNHPNDYDYEIHYDQKP